METIEGDKAFDEAVSLVQQQISDYQETTSQKLQKLEATIEVARKLMLEMMKMKAQQLEERLVDFEPDFGIGNKIQEWPNPEGEEYAHAAWEVYTGDPIYDEEQEGEGQECWPEQEFILAAVNGGSLDTPNPLQIEICRNERSEELAEFANIQNLQQGGGNNNLNNEMIPIQLEEVCSMIPTSRDIVEAFHSKRSVKDFPTAEISYDLGIRSSNFGKDNMLIFDPGGQVQNKQLKGVNHNSKDMSRSEVPLGEAVMKDSVGSKFRHWQDIDFLAIEQQLLEEPSRLHRKVFIIEIEISARLQGQGQNIQKESAGFDKIVGEINQQFVDYVRTGMIALSYKDQYMVLGQGRHEIYKSMGPAYHDASRKSVATYIFDPGGDSTCLHGVLHIFVGILKVHHMLQDILFESLSKRWREGQKCQIHHEDMVVFKGEGLSEIVW